MLLKGSSCFWTENFHCSENFTKYNFFYSLPLRILLMPLITRSHERHDQYKICFTDKKFWKLQKIEINHAKERSVTALFSKDSGHVFGRKVGNEFRVMLRGKQLDEKNLLTLSGCTIYTDLIEYKTVADTKVQVSKCCVAFRQFKDKTWRHHNRWTKRGLSNIWKAKNHTADLFFHGLHIDLRNKSDEKHPVHLSVLFVLFSILGSLQISLLTKKTLQHCCSNTGCEPIL